MKKNGFISTAIIYTFFTTFLLLMIFLLNNYSRVHFLLDEVKNDIKEDFVVDDLRDVNLYIYIKNSGSSNYEPVDVLPGGNYNLDSQSCDYDKAYVSYENGQLVINSGGRTTCTVYMSKN